MYNYYLQFYLSNFYCTLLGAGIPRAAFKGGMFPERIPGPQVRRAARFPEGVGGGGAKRKNERLEDRSSSLSHIIANRVYSKGIPWLNSPFHNRGYCSLSLPASPSATSTSTAEMRFLQVL
jgi:hypothetical protein